MVKGAAGAFDGAPVGGVEVGVFERAVVVEGKAEVGDFAALFKEHLFVESLNLVEGIYLILRQLLASGRKRCLAGGKRRVRGMTDRGSRTSGRERWLGGMMSRGSRVSSGP